MNKLLIANWKSNPGTIKEAIKLAKALDNKGVVIAPPHIFLHEVNKTTKKAEIAAQDAFWGDLGAYTGEISWRHLVEMGIKYVILGHSERRKYMGETDEFISHKVRACLGAGLKVILCVGEPEDVRNHGLDRAKDFVRHQLETALKGTENLKLKTENLAVAYEPIWAIGTGKPDSPESAAEMANFIKSIVKGQLSVIPMVLYGGSVNASNGHSYLSRPEIDGALVGGASLRPKEFNSLLLSK